MSDPVPYLTITIRTDPDLQLSFPYQQFMLWCARQSIDHDACKSLTVYEDSMTAVLDVYDVDSNGDRLDPPTTTPQTVPINELPPLRNADS